MRNTFTHPTQGFAFLLLVLSAFAMGASVLFVRYADVGPFASAFWRVALALPALYLWAYFALRQDGESDKPTQARIFSYNRPVIIAGLLFAGDLIFWHLSIVNTTVANATFLATISPVWVLLLSGIVLKEVVPKAVWIGLLFCLLGGAALVGSSYTLAPERLIGDFYGVVTSCFFAGYFLAMRIARRSTPSSVAVFVSTIITAIGLLIAALIMEGNIFPQSTNGWLTLITLALVSQVAGQGLLAIAVGHLPAAITSLVIFLEAVAAAALGWFLLVEYLSSLQWFGGALIFVGIAIAKLMNNRS